MLDIQDQGQDNEVVLADGVAESMGGALVLRGSGNRVSIGAGCVGQQQIWLDLGDRCSLHIGDGVTLGHIFLHAAADGHVVIGSHSGLNGRVRFLLHEPGRISVGPGCLLAGDVDLMVSDMHSIVDVSTGNRINPPADIALGARVWIGQRSLVLKGAEVGSGSVVGAASVVRGRLPAETVSAGVPARVIRTGATWDFALLPLPEHSPPPAVSASKLLAAADHAGPRRTQAARRARQAVKKLFGGPR